MSKKKEEKITTKVGDVVTLSTGVKARVNAVAAALIDDMVSAIEIPDPPIWENPEKPGQKEPNPDDPKYLKELNAAYKKQGEATMDAMVLFGVDLIDGVPPKEEWLSKLQFLAKRRGQLDLSEYDLDNELEVEFLYKRYIAISSEDYSLITRRSGVTKEAVEEAEEIFQGGEKRDADTGSRAQ